MEAIRRSTTKTGYYSFESEETQEEIKTNVIASIVTVVLATTSLNYQANYALNSELETSVKEGHIQFRNKINEEVLFTESFLFNSQEKDDTINMNNKTLEVDDLADKVTQTQIDEIKAHFDTKLSSLEKNIVIQMKAQETNVISELKEYISKENKEIKKEKKEVKKEKKENWKFWVGSVVVPLLIVIITLWASKYFGI